MSNVTYATVYSQAADSEAGQAFERELAALRASDPRPHGQIVDGEELAVGVVFDRHDPVDGARIAGRGRNADADTVRRAVDSARGALPGWRRTDVTERVAILLRAVERIQSRRIALAALISYETGKTRADALAEVDECVAIIELFAAQVGAPEATGVALRAPADDATASVVLRPYGVFGVIAPFNFPLAISFAMVAAALIAGNTVVCKPSALTPASGRAFYDLLAEIGLPPGALNLLQGGAETGALLAEAEIDGLAFTGSADVGLGFSARFGGAPYVRPLIAEMGGKNPAIITAHAGPIDVAARAVVRSAYGMSGQKCNACSRAVVLDDVYDEFVDALRSEAAALRVGDPIDRSAFTGPVVSAASIERFSGAVEAGRRDGRLLFGGGTDTSAGNFVELTAIDGLPDGHELTREELFLPVLSVVRVRDLDAAMAEANAIRYGLSAGIFTTDPGERERFLDEIEAGITFVNNPGGATTGVWPGSQTMSGWKGSGSAGKGGFGPWYLQQFAREQSRTVFGRAS